MEDLRKRLDEVVLAAQTLVHHLQGDLTLVLAALDPLEQHPDLPMTCREEIQQAVTAIEATVRHVKDFQQALGTVQPSD